MSTATTTAATTAATGATTVASARRRADDEVVVTLPARAGRASGPGRAVGARTSSDDVAEATRLLLLDVARGDLPLGRAVSCPWVVERHGVGPAAARLAVGRLADAGLFTRAPFSTDSVVTWHPAQDRLLLRRLVRLVDAAADLAPDLEALPEPPLRPVAAERLGLTVPDDIARLVGLCRSLFTVLPEPVRSGSGPELLDIVEVLCGDEALTAHGARHAMPAEVRTVIVDGLEHAAHHGDWAAVRELVRTLVDALLPTVEAAAA